MAIRVKYIYRILFYFVILIVFVVLAFTVYMYRQNRGYSLSTLQMELKNYTDDIESQLAKGIKPNEVILDKRIDFTILDTFGFVKYDSMEQYESFVADQSDFYEVIKAKEIGEGSTLRSSNIDETIEYLFFAKKYANSIIKSYVKFNTLKPTQIEKDNKYFTIIVLLLLALIAAAFFISKKLLKPLKSYTQLTDAIKNSEDLEKVTFDNDDFGAVGKEIAQTFSQLDKAKKYKQQLTQDIAHELKTPVTAIKAYLETILQDTDMDNEQKLKFIESSYKQASRLADLISEVSTLNKLDDAIAMDKNQSIYPIEQVNFLSCIEEILNEIGYKLKQKNISLNLDIEPSLYINGCKSLIYSLFKNLIDNSIEHGGEGCSIYISSKSVAPMIEFTYEDSGRGIPAESLALVFERFYRANSGRTRREGESSGSGLGLAIVKNAVAFHKGSVTVENRTGGGVLFKFNLFSLS